MVLTARDALTERLIQVSAEARPPLSQDGGEVLYAVFAGEDAKRFLGLVSAKEIIASPERIFADLLPRRAPKPVPEEMLLDQVFRRLEQEGVGYLPVVDSRGSFLGVVTRLGIVHALLAENRRLTSCLFALQEQERRFLCHELHDALSQYLVALKVDLECLSLSVAGESKSYLEAICQTVEQLYLTLKRVIRGLYPQVLDQLGLADALKELVEEYRCRYAPVRFKLKVSGQFEDLKDEHALCLYRVAQEALTNVVRHAGASRVTICLCRSPEGFLDPCRRFFPTSCQPAVYLSICDDGQGLAAKSRRGFGVIGMRERVAALGGTLKLDSRPNQGVTVAVELPFS